MLAFRWAFTCLFVLLPLAPGNAGTPAKQADWPQWRGPHRDAISTETGLLKEWPKGGPPLVWDSRKVNGGISVGTGYSSLAIVQGKIFTMGDLTVDEKVEVKKGDKIQKKTIQKGDLFVFCLEETTGKELWKTKIGLRSQYGGYAGPRSIPTIDGDRVYVLSPHGPVVCLKVQDGTILWQKDLVKDFAGHRPGWGYSESPTIDHEKLICTPGGKKAGIVALDKLTGEMIWSSQLPSDCSAAYASIVSTEAGGIQQYITLMAQPLGLVGVDAKTGKFLWNYSKMGNGTANIPTPLVYGDYVFASTGYGAGAALVKLMSDGKDGIKAEEAYFLKGNNLQNQHGGMVMLGDYIYGGHGHGNGLPFCLDWKNGKLVWGPERGAGGGSAGVLYADGNLYFRYESGEMALIEATPKGYHLISSFRVPIGGNGWPHPVIHQGKLYLRGTDQILCYDIKQ